MNQTILFTPVGGTDPISLNNYHDGSILHICRFYKPDKVILYLPKVHMSVYIRPASQKSSQHSLRLKTATWMM